MLMRQISRETPPHNIIVARGRVLQRATSINQAELSFRRRSCFANIAFLQPFTNTLSDREFDDCGRKLSSTAGSVVSEEEEEEEEEVQNNFTQHHKRSASQDHYNRQRNKRIKCERDINNNIRKSRLSLMQSTSSSSCGLLSSSQDKGVIVLPMVIAWDWPFCDEGVARGVYTEHKFMICLPFNNGGTGETSGSTRKFAKISESNFSWTIGLSNNSSCELRSTVFWRMELEIIRNLNMLALIISRDITRGCGSAEYRAKRLKRVRKVYRLPDIYDVSTLSSTSYDWAIVIEALRRRDSRTNEYVPLQRQQKLKRSETLY